ncbi:MAG: hypothetical protein P8X83_04075 [Nitrosopumilaceae archaeon]
MDKSKIKKEIDDYFSRIEDPSAKAMHQFFKKKRKYIFGLWRVTNYSNVIPWIRLGIPSDETTPSLEIVLPILHGDMPKLWSQGKSYFRMVIGYKPGKHGPIIQFFTNYLGMHDVPEILEITTKFHRKIRSYSNFKDMK